MFLMRPVPILIAIAVVCFIVAQYGVSISEGPDSLGWTLRMVFGSLGAIAIVALFVIWYFSSNRGK